MVATYNDLVLCCASASEDDYFICKPHTIQSVRLPPAPEVYKNKAERIAVGFICDHPYYECDNDEHRGHNFVKVNSEYRYNVVRIVCRRELVISYIHCPRDLKCRYSLPTQVNGASQLCYPHQRLCLRTLISSKALLIMECYIGMGVGLIVNPNFLLGWIRS